MAVDFWSINQEDATMIDFVLANARDRFSNNDIKRIIIILWAIKNFAFRSADAV